jgi:hypothetical protein
MLQKAPTSWCVVSPKEVKIPNNYTKKLHKFPSILSGTFVNLLCKEIENFYKSSHRELGVMFWFHGFD